MPGTWPRPSSATSRSSRPSICPSIDPQSTPSFTSSRPSPPTRSTRSSPSSIFSPAISSKQQPEKTPYRGYIYPAYDQIVSEAARLRYRSNGQFTCPLVVRMPTGGGIFGGQTHSQSPEALFTHVAGLKTVVPSNPSDAKGLLIAAIEDPDPVIFLEPKRLYNGPFDGHHRSEERRVGKECRARR